LEKQPSPDEFAMLGLEVPLPEPERPADAVHGDLPAAPRYRHVYELALLDGCSWARLSRYELERDEWIMCMRVLRLRDEAYPSGKIFCQVLVVGTGYQVGEDAPSTGRLLMFEVVEEMEGGECKDVVEGDGTGINTGGAWPRKLRLISAVQERGPVLAVTVLRGMLLCGVGSRLMSFSYRDGNLTASGFLVCGFLVCRLAVLNHFVLVGDLYQGLQLVQWKTEKKTFAALSKNPATASAFTTDLLLDEPTLHLVLSEHGGRLRVFGYSRTQADARSGLHLVPRAAIQLGSQVTATIKVALPTLAPAAGTSAMRSGSGSDGGAVRTALVVVTADGGIGLLTPLGEAPHRRLSFLTQKLVTAVPHPAGLHPVSFRAHRSGAVSPQELKFVVDGALLVCFASLDRAAQDKLAHQIGTTPGQLLADIAALSHDAVRSLHNL